MNILFVFSNWNNLESMKWLRISHNFFIVFCVYSAEFTQFKYNKSLKRFSSYKKPIKLRLHYWIQINWFALNFKCMWDRCFKIFRYVFIDFIPTIAYNPINKPTNLGNAKPFQPVYCIFEYKTDMILLIEVFVCV